MSPVGLERTVARALDKRPEDGFDTCREFAAALGATAPPSARRHVAAVVAEPTEAKEAAASAHGAGGVSDPIVVSAEAGREPVGRSPPARVWSQPLAVVPIGVLAVAVAVLLGLLLISNRGGEPASIGGEPALVGTEPLLPEAVPALGETQPLADTAEPDSGGTGAALGGADSLLEGAEAELSAPEPVGVASLAPSLVGWSRIPHDEAVFAGGRGVVVASVTGGGPRLVAVGSVAYPGAQRASAWTSVDGATWSRVPWTLVDGQSVSRVRNSESGSGEPGIHTSMNSVTACGPGLVAVGRDGPRAAVRTSADGVRWSRVPHDEGVFGGSGVREMRSVTTGGPGLVAVGLENSNRSIDAAAWTSVDGLSWTRVLRNTPVTNEEGDQWMSSVTAGGPGLVAVGSDNSDPSDDERAVGAVWVAATNSGAAVESGDDGTGVEGGDPLLAPRPGSVFRFDPGTDQI